jgi:hypothetical protein
MHINEILLTVIAIIIYTIDLTIRDHHLAMEEQLHYKLFSTRSSHERPAWADRPLVGREYLKEASRCMIQAAFYICFENVLLSTHSDKDLLNRVVPQ